MIEKTNESQSISLTENPGELIANIPGILGFYPTESIVFIAMIQQDAKNRFAIGPTIRIDIEDIELLAEIGSALRPVKPDFVFAVIISNQWDCGDFQRTIRKLMDASESGILRVEACWMTQSVLSGESYQLAFGPSAEQIVDGQQSESASWERGTISGIVHAAATQSMLKAGHLPEISREEAFSYFRKENQFITAAEAHDLEQHASKLSNISLQAIYGENSKAEYDGALERFSHLIESIREMSLSDVLKDFTLLRDSAVFLSSSLLRDSVLHFCVDHPQPTKTLFLALSQTFRGEIRANALCMYSIAVISEELGMKAIPALEEALRSAPRHNLSRLLRQALQEGRADSIIQACLKGNEIVRRRYSASNANHSDNDPHANGSAQAA